MSRCHGQVPTTVAVSISAPKHPEAP
jgi:hypothetical protein